MKKLRRHLTRALLGVVIAVSVVLAGLMVVLPLLTGMQVYVLTSGSMTGTIDKGSLVYDTKVPVSSLKKGDIITYSPPGNLPLVTHRIYSVTHKPDGTPLFRTKGDYNKAADPWVFRLNHPTQARYVFHIPWIGWIFLVLSIRIVRILLLAVPALIVAVAMLWGLWKEAGEELPRIC